MKIIDPILFHDYDGDLVGSEVEKGQKLYRDSEGLYQHFDSDLDPETVMYEVMTVNAAKNEAGSLNWAVSLLHPVRVKGECCMTRGHFHENLNCEEYYWCAEGEGLLMMMDLEGHDWCERVYKGSLHHIDGRHAHRLINTGESDLRVVCCWNSNAGHDYARVENNPFPHRVFIREGKLVTEDAQG